MKPGGGRAKGAAFERSVAAVLRELWPSAQRGLGQARGGGEAADTEGTPYWVQCKHGARPNIASAYQQAEQDRRAAGDERTILVITRQDRGPILVTMDLDAWVARQQVMIEHIQRCILHQAPAVNHQNVPSEAIGAADRAQRKSAKRKGGTVYRADARDVAERLCAQLEVMLGGRR